MTFEAAASASARESLFEHDLESLTAACEAMALPRRTGGQVLKWVYEKGTVDFAQMSDLSKDARAKLTERFCGLQGTVIRHQVATDDTQKLLIEWGDTEPAPEGTAHRIAGTRSDRCHHAAVHGAERVARPRLDRHAQLPRRGVDHLDG